MFGDGSENRYAGFIAARTIACSATAPFTFEFITNVCSHMARTENR